MKKTVRYLKVGLLASLLLLLNVGRSQATTVDATLSFNPSTASTTDSGSNVTYIARVNPGSNTVNGINAVQMDITFDAGVVNLVSLTAVAPFSIMTPQDITAANATGTISVALYIPASSITTTSNLATLVFSPQGVGTDSQINFANTSDVIENSTAASVLGTRTGATVTVATSGTDVTPPVISGGSPTGTLPAGTSQTTVSVTTNENSDCRYSTTSGVGYGSMTSNFTAGQGTTAHSFIATGLLNGSSYGYYVRCQDITGNNNLIDYPISFSIASPEVAVTTIPAIQSSSSSDDHRSSSKKKSTPSRYISNAKKSVGFGQILVQRGKKFSKNSLVLLYFGKPGGGYYAPTRVITSKSGAFMVTYKVNKPKGRYGWYVVDTKTGKKSKTTYYKVK